MIRAAFFDVDNTLYDWQSLRFIPSGIEAIKKISRKGVKVFVCSARPYATLKEFGVLDLGIRWNGVISNCGAYVSLGNRTLRKMTMSHQTLSKLCSIATSHSLTMELVTIKTRFLIAPGNTFMQNYRGTYADAAPPVHPFRNQQATGALLFAPEEYDELFKKELPHLHYFRFHECGLDISEGEHRKGDGIAVIAKELGLTREECLGFGDDIQDITMGESSIFVCVGNGKEEAKRAADYVCPPIAEDGLAQALRYYEVLL